MKSFRNPKYLERYEDVVFDLEQVTLMNKKEMVQDLLQIIQEMLLHLIGIIQNYLLILE